MYSKNEQKLQIVQPCFSSYKQRKREFHLDMEVDENEDNQHKRPHSPETQESSCKRARYENELERMMSDTSLSGNETDNARSKNDQSQGSTRKIQIRRKKIKKSKFMGEITEFT